MSLSLCTTQTLHFHHRCMACLGANELAAITNLYLFRVNIIPHVPYFQVLIAK